MPTLPPTSLSADSLIPASLFPASLYLGGARSGKSARAEAAAEATGLDPVYIATAEPFDAEMAERLAEHRARRDARWRTVEEPIGLAAALMRETAPGRVVLVDCLTVWLGNLMHHERPVEQAEAALLTGLASRKGPVILVSNEVGLSIVPETPLGRRFRDVQGRLNQAVAAACSKVVFMAAGLPLTLKDETRKDEMP